MNRRYKNSIGVCDLNIPIDSATRIAWDALRVLAGDRVFAGKGKGGGAIFMAPIMHILFRYSERFQVRGEKFPG